MTVIAAGGRERRRQELRDLWLYRDLFLAFLARDVKVRYKQTALGIVWVLLQPLLTGGVLALVFARIGAAREAGAGNTMLYFLAALTPWSAFASGVQNAAVSLETNAHLVTKVYFPRMLAPAACAGGAALDFLVMFPVVLLASALGGEFHPGHLLAMPGLLAIQLAAMLGAGLALGALNAQYHDIRYAVPFVLQAGMFATVLLPMAEWSPGVRLLMELNPMLGLVETHRALAMGLPVPFRALGISAASSLALLLAGFEFFRRREARLADLL